MSLRPESPLDESTETLGDEHNTSSSLEEAPKSKDAMGIVGKLVNDFLATRGEITRNVRADVVFENLSVEGSGKGVCDSTIY